jgi:tetratricopeptide (TPR) repeat protein
MDATFYLRWGNLGDACRWTPGEQHRANDAYRKAIKLIREEMARTPDHGDLESLLATYLAKIGDKKQALAVAKSVKETAESDISSNLALTYELCQNRPKALEWLKLALAKGYSLKEVENEPEFNELRKDPAYQTMGEFCLGLLLQPHQPRPGTDAGRKPWNYTSSGLGPGIPSLSTYVESVRKLE